MKKKLTKLLAVLAAVVCILALPLSVSAAPYIEEGTLTEEEAQNYSQATGMEQMFALLFSDGAEAILPGLEASGDYFYEKLAAQVKESGADLGNYVQTKSVEGEISGDELTLTYKLECELLDAEVISSFRLDIGNSKIIPLDFTLNPQYPMSVNMANAARNTIIGIAIVFCILIFLSFIIGLLKYVNPEYRKKKKAEPVKETAVKAEEPKAAAKEIPVASNDEEIVAVIAAAIAAAQAENPNSTYTVSSIRRAAGAKRWKRV